MKWLFPSRCVSMLGFVWWTIAAFNVVGQTQVTTLPREAADVFWEGAGVDPFFSYLSVEQIYAASEFSSFPSDTILIREIAFRLDEGSQTPLDATFETIHLRMDTFTGSMQEVVERKSGFRGEGTVVYNATSVNLRARIGKADAFDVRFPFQKPFLYNRREGQLALEISAGGSFGGSRFMDAASNYAIPGDPSSETTFDRGAYIFREQFFGTRRLGPATIVTQFVYDSVIAVDSIHVFTDNVQIEFTKPKELDSAQVEGANKASGPYAFVREAQLTTIEEDRMRAVLPLRTGNLFFRIRAELRQTP